MSAGTLWSCKIKGDVTIRKQRFGIDNSLDYIWLSLQLEKGQIKLPVSIIQIQPIFAQGYRTYSDQGYNSKNVFKGSFHFPFLKILNFLLKISLKFNIFGSHPPSHQWHQVDICIWVKSIVHAGSFFRNWKAFRWRNITLLYDLRTILLYSASQHILMVRENLCRRWNILLENLHFTITFSTMMRSETCISELGTFTSPAGVNFS